MIGQFVRFVNMPADPATDAACHRPDLPPAISVERPQVGDGPDLWRLARDSGELDLNSPYCYLLWCRDFSQTSVVARAGRTVVGFVTGHVRPDAADTLFVWQVAVSRAYRGQRVGRRMLDRLASVMHRLGCRYLEATVSPGNVPSARMFTSFARAQAAPLAWSGGFDAAMFPDHHEREDLVRIGPLRGGPEHGRHVRCQ
jgi:L-2,4-diaminobutyric acid acetyltransferase